MVVFTLALRVVGLASFDKQKQRSHAKEVNNTVRLDGYALRFDTGMY